MTFVCIVARTFKKMGVCTHCDDGACSVFYGKRMAGRRAEPGPHLVLCELRVHVHLEGGGEEAMVRLHQAPEPDTGGTQLSPPEHPPP